MIPQARNLTWLPPLVLAMCTACGHGNNGNADTDPGDAPTAIPWTDETVPAQAIDTLPPLPAESIAVRPAAIRDTLLIEGTPEATTATLVDAPSDFALPFSTYVPDGISTEFGADGDVDAVRFTAAFSGRPDPNAYMHVFVYPAGTTGIQARTSAFAFMRSRMLVGDAANPIEAPAWAREAYTLSYSGNAGVRYVGRLILATHAGRYFHVLTHYPAEYGDGLGPRYTRILQWWRWEDTGRPLVRE
jgi:hypothetical protein